MKKILSLLVIFLALMGGNALAETFEPTAQHAIVVESNSGKILYEKNAQKAVPVSSLTKLLTIYMVYKQIDSGKLTWETPVDISDYAYALTTDYSINNVPLDARRYTVKELVEVTLVQNANSSAIALAEHIGGSESKFVDMMRKQLSDWGISDVTIVNASGLPNTYLGENRYPDSDENDKNKLSAYDLALIAYHLVNDFPDVLRLASTQSLSFEGYTLYNSNYMLENMFYYRPGVDGLLLGTSKVSGDSFVTTSTENKIPVISVTLRAKESSSNPYAVFEVTSALLDYVQTNFKQKTLLKKGQSYKDSSIPVTDGKSDKVSSVAADDLKVVSKVSTDLKETIKTVDTVKKLTAPVIAGQPVGVANFKDPDKVGNGYLAQEPSVQMVTKSDIQADFFLKIWWNHFVNYVNENL